MSQSPEPARSSQPMRSSPSHPFVCAGCSCLCDDIMLSDQFSATDGSKFCVKGSEWFQSLSWKTEHRIGTIRTSYERALLAAQKLFESAQAPLIAGLDGLCTASQQAAWRLADRSRATIDITLDSSCRASSHALQRVGHVTASFGELAQRSDLIVLWFCDPLTSHPRFWERCLRPDSDRDRTIIVVDDRETLSAGQATQFIRLNRNAGATALSVMRALLLDCPIRNSAVWEQTGRDLDQWRDLLQTFRNASYGAILTSCDSRLVEQAASLTQSKSADVSGQKSQYQGQPEGELENEHLAWLVRALNDTTRFVSMSLRNDGNSLSAENVLAWGSGYSSQVNLSRGYARSCYDEYSAEQCLADRACDLIVIASMVGFSKAWDHLSQSAQAHFLRTPKIVLNETAVPYPFEPQVEFSVARAGYTAAGDFCRQDDVAIPLRPIKNVPGLITAVAILDRLNESKL